MAIFAVAKDEIHVIVVSRMFAGSLAGSRFLYGFRNCWSDVVQWDKPALLRFSGNYHMAKELECITAVQLAILT